MRATPTNEGGRVQRRSAPAFSSLARDDIEFDEITPAEISMFVNVNFEADLSSALSRENTTSSFIEKTIPETNRKGVKIVWIQHAKTRELVPITLHDGLTNVDDSADLAENSNDANDDVYSPLLMPSSLSERDLDGENGFRFYQQLYLIRIGYELSLHCSIYDDLLAADLEGGRAKEYRMNKSDQAYADGTMLVRFAFFFVQGMILIYGMLY